MTYKAQAYRIRCVYQTGENNLNIGFNVSTLTTAGTIANTGPPPTCTMKICNSNGDDISQAEIGDSLMLKVKWFMWLYLFSWETATCVSGRYLEQLLHSMMEMATLERKM